MFMLFGVCFGFCCWVVWWVLLVVCYALRLFACWWYVIASVVVYCCLCVVGWLFGGFRRVILWFVAMLLWCLVGMVACGCLCCGLIAVVYGSLLRLGGVWVVVCFWLCASGGGLLL